MGSLFHPLFPAVPLLCQINYQLFENCQKPNLEMEEAMMEPDGRRKKCFGCTSLRSGAIIIGAFDIVVSTIAIVVSVVAMMNAQVKSELKEETSWSDASQSIFILGKIVVFRCTFEIVVASLLIHGVRKKRASLMKPWIIWSGIWLVLGLVNILLAIFTFNFATVMINVATWILAVYVFLVVAAHKLEIEQGEEDSRYGIIIQRVLVF